MLFFVIELDEERIKRDRIINLDAAYRTIEKTFAQKDVTLYGQRGTVRTYTRNIDKHDFEYLWMVNMPFKRDAWFGYYIKQWRFLIVDEDTGEIDTDEDLLEEWTDRANWEDVLQEQERFLAERRREAAKEGN